MKIACASLVLLLFTGCFITSGIATNEATEQVDRAKIVQLEVTLRQAAQAQEAYFAENGSFATDIAALNMTVPPEIALVVTMPNAAEYCIQGTHTEVEGSLWHISRSEPTPAEGAC